MFENKLSNTVKQLVPYFVPLLRSTALKNKFDIPDASAFQLFHLHCAQCLLENLQTSWYQSAVMSGSRGTPRAPSLDRCWRWGVWGKLLVALSSSTFTQTAVRGSQTGSSFHLRFYFILLCPYVKIVECSYLILLHAIYLYLYSQKRFGVIKSTCLPLFVFKDEEF